LLRGQGLDGILIDTGELRALGGQPGGGAWPVALQGGGDVALRDRALATSSPLGTVFDRRGLAGHILDPRSGLPSAVPWRRVSISARRAGLADALSTAACLMAQAEDVAALVAVFDGARIEALD
jgi:thiamine biosynthesis lipoprotein